MIMRMRMTNDDDNDSSNINETIKTFYFFRKRFHKHKKRNVYEVIRALLSFLLFFFTKKFHCTKSTKSTKKHKKHVKSVKTQIHKQKQKRQRFYALKEHLKGKKSLV